MRIFDLFWSSEKRAERVEPTFPRADAVVADFNDPRFREWLTNGELENSAGAALNYRTSLKMATAFRCTTLLAGTVANLPLDLKLRQDNKARVDASDHPLWPVLKRKPNTWQTPRQFKSLMQTSVLLRGNGYALIVRSLGRVRMLLPLVGHMEVAQLPDNRLQYTYTRKDGSKIVLPQEDVFHLYNFSLDGICGVSVLTFARETLGLSLTLDRHAGKLFRNGTAAGGVFTAQKEVKPTQMARLKTDIEAFRGADNESSYHDLILEEGMTYNKIGMTSSDAQFIELKEMSAYDIATFFGVPPHMVGLVSKTTSWGSGIEQQNIAFVTYTLNDYLSMWGECIRRDLLGEDADPRLYAMINPAGLLKGDIKTRYWGYATGRQWGWLSANDVLEKEDEDPIPNGDIYLEPTNMQEAGTPPEDPSGQAPPQPAKK